MLSDELSAWFSGFWDSLGAQLDRGEVPKIQRHRLHQRSPTDLMVREVSVPDPGMFLHTFRVQAQSDPVKELLDLLRTRPDESGQLLADSKGAPISDEDHAVRQLVNKAVFPFLCKALALRESNAPTREIAEQAFEETIRPLLASEISLVRIAPLPYLLPVAADVRLDVGVRIRNVRNWEVNDWIDNSAAFDVQVSVEEASNLHVVAEVETKSSQRDSAQLFRQNRELMGYTITALRLATGREVDVPFVQTLRNTAVWGRSYDVMPRARWPLGADSFLTETQITELLAIYGSIKSSSSKHPLAIRRWDAAITRRNDEDGLIDCWVALESLLTPDSTSEVKYRASLRGALVAGRNPEERIDTYKLLKRSYDCRCDIVHANASKARRRRGRKRVSTDLHDLLLKTRESLRLILIKALEDGFSPEELEAQFLKGGSRRSGESP